MNWIGKHNNNCIDLANKIMWVRIEEGGKTVEKYGPTKYIIPPKLIKILTVFKEKFNKLGKLNQCSEEHLFVTTKGTPPKSSALSEWITNNVIKSGGTKIKTQRYVDKKKGKKTENHLIDNEFKHLNGKNIGHSFNGYVYDAIIIKRKLNEQNGKVVQLYKIHYKMISDPYKWALNHI